MVDAAFGKTVRIEVVESSVERISVVALLVRIAEDAFADKCVVGLVGLVDVEVSRQDSRQILASLPLPEKRWKIILSCPLPTLSSTMF